MGSLIGMRTVLAPVIEYIWPTTWLAVAAADVYVSEGPRPDT